MLFIPFLSEKKRGNKSSFQVFNRFDNDQSTFTAKLRFSFFISAFLVFHLPDQLFWFSGFLVFWFSGFLVFSFSAFLLFCFFAFQLLIFSAFQLFCFSTSLLFCFSAFQLLCFSAFQLFSFSASLLFSFSFPLFRLSPFLLFNFLATKRLWHAAPRSLIHLSFSDQLPIFFLVFCLHYLKN